MESFLVSFGCLSLDFHRAAKMHSMRPFRVTAFGELLPNMLPNHGLSSGHVEPGQKLLTVSGETVERGSVFRIAAELAAEKKLHHGGQSHTKTPRLPCHAVRPRLAITCLPTTVVHGAREANVASPSTSS